MKKASLQGLSFRNDVELDGNELTAKISDSHREFLFGAYHLVSRPYYRPIGPPPERTQDGTNNSVNETIDGSVFTRWNRIADYRPPNLREWAARRHVDITTLNNSVLANTPELAPAD
jgi:hypothetical protein